MKSVESPGDLFFDQLRDIHSMEQQLFDSFPYLVELTSNPPLRSVVTHYLADLEISLVKVGEIFERFDVSIGDDKCKAVEGLAQGGENHLRGVSHAATRDLMMIAHCLRVAHYAIAAYEITGRLSHRLGLHEESAALATILDGKLRSAESLMDLEPGIFQIANAI